MGLRILVTGSRTWADRAMIRAALAEVWNPDLKLVSGACPTGADALCEACWAQWGGTIERHPADWGEYDAVAPMLATAGSLPDGPAFHVAFKWDGYRTCLRIAGGTTPVGGDQPQRQRHDRAISRAGRHRGHSGQPGSRR
ncbi:SLOG family protein [Amycolatopsis echigonensis]|uniref:DUF2493 domain-containing protein n=1 Tax=Amycolatopsis echigonensis TaxID=2576905 RepID=A0A8E2BAI6_9PSEU|nr:DUF2493 domain-containing protein [Amycolatopsis echigonensis]